MLLQAMAVFHLQCVVHRGCVSGIALDVEQITARTDAEAVSEAEARFARLLGPRSGLAVWTSRLALLPNAPAEAHETEGQAPLVSDIGPRSGSRKAHRGP
jgi:hypothetical protein